MAKFLGTLSIMSEKIALNTGVPYIFVILLAYLATSKVPTTPRNVDANCSISQCFQNSNQNCWGGGGHYVPHALPLKPLVLIVQDCMYIVLSKYDCKVQTGFVSTCNIKEKTKTKFYNLY